MYASWGDSERDSSSENASLIAISTPVQTTDACREGGPEHTHFATHPATIHYSILVASSISSPNRRNSIPNNLNVSTDARLHVPSHGPKHAKLTLLWCMTLNPCLWPGTCQNR